MKWSGNINYLNKVIAEFDTRLKVLEAKLDDKPERPEPIKRKPGRPKKVVEDATD